MSNITITGEMIVFNEGGCHPDKVMIAVGDKPDSECWMARFTALGEIIRESGLKMDPGATLDTFGSVTITIEQDEECK